MSIINMEQASDKVIKFTPKPYELGNGETVYIHRLSWVDFEAMWHAITVVISDVSNLQSLAGDLRDCVSVSIAATKQTDSQNPAEPQMMAMMTARREGFSALMRDLHDAPELVVDLLSRCVRDGDGKRKDKAYFKDENFDFSDVIVLLLMAVNINFLENQEVLGFFGATMPNLLSAIGVSAPTQNEMES